MSLAIEVDQVAAVLLADGKWHLVENASFDIDAYEYRRTSESEDGAQQGMRLGGGDEPLIPARGARWDERTEAGGLRTVFCPLTAVQAVAYASRARRGDELATR